MARLKVEDIDVDRMMIRVHLAKRNKDRYTPLSKVALETLDAYKKGSRPQYWLFPGAREGRHLTTRSVQKVLESLVYRTGGGAPGRLGSVAHLARGDPAALATEWAVEENPHRTQHPSRHDVVLHLQCAHPVRRTSGVRTRHDPGAGPVWHDHEGADTEAGASVGETPEGMRPGSVRPDGE